MESPTKVYLACSDGGESRYMTVAFTPPPDYTDIVAFNGRLFVEIDGKWEISSGGRVDAASAYINNLGIIDFGDRATGMNYKAEVCSVNIKNEWGEAVYSEEWLLEPFFTGSSGDA